MPRRSSLQLSVPAEEQQTDKKDETPEQRTRRLANQRGRKLIDYMKSVGRLGGTGYQLSPDDAERLITRLTAEFNFMTEQLRHGSSSPTDEDLI